MSTLDPDLLRAFVAVADTLSFTRAAEQLNRTQAAVSLQVRRLERRVDAALFRRSTSRVELTANGEAFLADARQILTLNAQALARMSGRAESGRVRLGVMEDLGAKVLPQALATATARFPGVVVEMETGLTARMLKRLGSSFDAVIAMHGAGASEGELLRREEAVWAVGADLSVAGRDPLPLALSQPDCLFRAWALDALNAAGRAWRLAYVCQSLAATEALALEGLAVTVAKRSLLSPLLRAAPDSLGLPALPGAEIRLHRADGQQATATRFLDALAIGLRA